MYQDAKGKRLTLYVSRIAAEHRDTAFRFSQEDKVAVFYWIDGTLGYALSGELAEAAAARHGDDRLQTAQSLSTDGPAPAPPRKESGCSRDSYNVAPAPAIGFLMLIKRPSDIQPSEITPPRDLCAAGASS